MHMRRCQGAPLKGFRDRVCEWVFGQSFFPIRNVVFCGGLFLGITWRGDDEGGFYFLEFKTCIGIGWKRTRANPGIERGAKGRWMCRDSIGRPVPICLTEHNLWEKENIHICTYMGMGISMCVYSTVEVCTISPRALFFADNSRERASWKEALNLRIRLQLN